MSPARRTLLACAAVTLLCLVASLPPIGSRATAAAPRTGYEMPFQCAELWRGTTRKGHSPSQKAVDFNRTKDEGMPVVASASGVVTKVQAGPKGGYGRLVTIDHGNGESSLYAHLKRTLVRTGESVDQGRLIGLVGKSGRTTGAHLHYERISNRKVVDAWFGGRKFAMGSTAGSANCVDVPLAADFDGDRIADLAVYRRESRSSYVVQRPGQADLVLPARHAADQPVVGDWDGDGRADVGFRAIKKPNFTLRSAAGTTTVRWGNRKDTAVAGDWNGDRRWEIGVHRAAKARFLLRMPDGAKQVVRLGDSNDLPVTGDWNGDGITDVGVYDQATAVFTLQLVGATAPGFPRRVAFGAPGDLPVTGDWDGDGIADLGTWTPRTAVFSRLQGETAGQGRKVLTTQFGRPRR